MSAAIRAEPLAREAFAAFGDVLETVGEPDKIINQGLCGRWHDLAKLDVTDGRVGLSLFKAELRSLPYSLDMMERHPDGSQAFLPMSPDPFLVVVA
ncbi:MAG: ureidoglycolate lyase, partial [Methyloligellaceae bacterium]